MYPVNDQMRTHIDTAAHITEDSALDGWVRGGVQTRVVGDEVY